MKTFVRLHGGRLKRERHRFGGDCRQHFIDAWRWEWGTPIPASAQRRLSGVGPEELTTAEHRSNGNGNSAQTIPVRVVSCGTDLELDLIGDIDTVVYLFVPRPPKRTGHHTVPRPWRPKKCLISIIDEAIRDAN